MKYEREQNISSISSIHFVKYIQEISQQIDCIRISSLSVIFTIILINYSMMQIDLLASSLSDHQKSRMKWNVLFDRSRSNIFFLVSALNLPPYCHTMTKLIAVILQNALSTI